MVLRGVMALLFVNQQIIRISNRIRHLSRATLTPYRPILAVSNIDRSIFAGIARSEKSMAKYV